MLHPTAPIGVLDSGIGGFSVVRQVQRLLPGEELIYFGDGAHIPYGNHSEETVVAMARYMFSFLEERGVKALLVACNTISCVLERCADAASCPVFSAVQAGAEAAARHYFGKSAAALTTYEAASMAAILPAPLKRTPSSPLVRRLAARLVKRIPLY